MRRHIGNSATLQCTSGLARCFSCCVLRLGDEAQVAGCAHGDRSPDAMPGPHPPRPQERVQQERSSPQSPRKASRVTPALNMPEPSRVCGEKSVCRCAALRSYTLPWGLGGIEGGGATETLASARVGSDGGRPHRFRRGDQACQPQPYGQDRTPAAAASFSGGCCATVLRAAEAATEAAQLAEAAASTMMVQTGESWSR